MKPGDMIYLARFESLAPCMKFQFAAPKDMMFAGIFLGTTKRFPARGDVPPNFPHFNPYQALRKLGLGFVGKHTNVSAKDAVLKYGLSPESVEEGKTYTIEAGSARPAMTDESARALIKKHAAMYGVDNLYDPAHWLVEAVKEAAGS